MKCLKISVLKTKYYFKGIGDIMEQKSLRVLDTNKTFFSKITSTITKMLIPTKLSLNSMMISIKRNNLIKAYTNYSLAVEENDIDKKEILLKCLVDNTENFKYLTDEIYVYYEQNNLNNCSITPPQLVKMLYVCTYLAITICTFLLAFFPIKIDVHAL